MISDLTSDSSGDNQPQWVLQVMRRCRARHTPVPAVSNNVQWHFEELIGRRASDAIQ